MKLRYALLSACLLSGALLLPKPGAAAAADKPIRVFLDNKQINFEVDPVLENGTTLVPFRPIFEKLGLEVGWDEETQTVTGTKEGLTIRLVIDDTEASVNDVTSTLELAPRLVEGNTLVPLRFVSEASGKDVNWVQSSSTAYLKSRKGSSSTSSGSVDGGPSSTSSGGVGGTDSAKTEKGDYEYPNGDKYTGQLVGGVPEGKGKVVGADGSVIFSGTFSNGERVNGTLYYANGDKYTGSFASDLPSGSGKLVYKNGDAYEGDFAGGVREGKGTFTTSKGETVVGDFKNDMKNGMINYYDKKGTLLSVSEYTNDVLVSKVEMTDETSVLPNTNPSSPTDPRNKENERHDQSVNDIKERYNQSKKELDDQVAQLRKNNPGAYSSQATYDKALAEARDKETEILNKINALTSSSSKAAETAMAELEKQLTDNQAEIDRIYAKGVAQQQLESLKEQLSRLKEDYNAELKKENDRHTYAMKQLK
ncbi:Protease inhibitor precursor [Paenibacillus konkukensis]|uniref:Protease inhibitor n=1 Tax=Paenibacillus konkukensis TaxID=2020716 RepID=A0ABY4RR94_9BACL|nr:stalk domain-containing protein [Paenibacillus konkukensis]UQZ84668.1 Protease inhibitor precursor [Paenibacillus konkukensis]